MKLKCTLAAFVGLGLMFSGSKMLVAEDKPAVDELKWYTNAKEAVEVAQKEKKVLLFDFTGSDWCHWCIKLKEEVFSTPEFKAFAKEHLVLVELDFPRAKPQSDEEKKQNKELQEKYKVQGYPTLLFLSPKGEELGKLVGFKPTEAFLKDAAEFVAKAK